MKIPTPIFIGLRYTRAKRRNQFISFVSGFSLAGMTLGAVALIVVMSVMNGFDREIKQRLLQIIPHVELYSGSGLSDWQALVERAELHPQIAAAAPYVDRDAMVSFEQGMQGVQLRGLLPQDIPRLSTLQEHMLLGQLDALQAGEYNIIIGRLLARYLGVATGDKISVTLPQLTVTPAGVFPRIKRFTVAGVFEVGGQLDQSFALIHLGDAQKLFRLGDKVDGVQLETTDRYLSKQIGYGLWQSLPGAQQQAVAVRDWSETQGSLFAAIKMEKTVVSTLLMIVIAVAAFNIISSLVLMVADKRSDIAVLRTLGLTRVQVTAIFIVQGVAIGLVGILVGALVGAAIAVNVGYIVAFFETLTGLRIFDPQVYFISHMPSRLLWSDVVTVMTVGLSLSFLSTLYPAYRASTVEPAEALRYE
ncbi:lipoprotein-releasing ABC transporter permease subunit [Pseudomaricurvus alcaniphilus]|uniref:lipoprotein-releasing ABC transporter permease subunit n=1 Tax=Pseudomaricurvus alcaniphilus TaxID=1166482 RepID=UPI001407DEB6|nr:lipoprotein-releasing ABC transporter permease subunit [Pseudomaricurvus alcaniphilus]NHN35946.1 lipoprotein-releasing ABC transporter permease subunit [Pseudomaricurvus alcaniphilus]